MAKQQKHQTRPELAVAHDVGTINPAEFVVARPKLKIYGMTFDAGTPLSEIQTRLKMVATPVDMQTIAKNLLRCGHVIRAEATPPRPVRTSAVLSIEDAARDLAEQYGIDPRSIEATGEDGLITVDDVQKVIDAGSGTGGGEGEPAKSTGGVNATEPAIKLAQEHDIDLAGITGTGKGGQVIAPDVQKAIDDKGSE